MPPLTDQSGMFRGLPGPIKQTYRNTVFSLDLQSFPCSCQITGKSDRWRYPQGRSFKLAADDRTKTGIARACYGLRRRVQGKSAANARAPVTTDKCWGCVAVEAVHHAPCSDRFPT